MVQQHGERELHARTVSVPRSVKVHALLMEHHVCRVVNNPKCSRSTKPRAPSLNIHLRHRLVPSVRARTNRSVCCSSTACPPHHGVASSCAPHVGNVLLPAIHATNNKCALTPTQLTITTAPCRRARCMARAPSPAARTRCLCSPQRGNGISPRNMQADACATWRRRIIQRAPQRVSPQSHS